MKKQKTAGMGLNQRERLAALHYLEHGDKTAAYQSAYKARGTRRSTYAAASALFARPHVAAWVAAQQAEAQERAVVKQAAVLGALQEMAFCSIQDFMERNEADEVVVKDLDRMPEKAARCIQKISFDNNGRPRIELCNKLGALTLLGQHTGAFKDPAKDGDKDAPGILIINPFGVAHGEK